MMHPSLPMSHKQEDELGALCSARVATFVECTVVVANNRALDSQRINAYQNLG